MPRLEQIWLKRMKRGPMDPVHEATLVAGRGLVGNADQGGHRQVTIISADRWREIVAALGVPLDPATRRGNLLVSGVDLAETCGRVLRVGACRLQINGETRPCEPWTRLIRACVLSWPSAGAVASTRRCSTMGPSGSGTRSGGMTVLSCDVIDVPCGEGNADRRSRWND